MSIPNSLTITSKGDRKLLIYIALAGLSAEFGRCLMLDLTLWDFGGFPASFLKQWCSIFLAAVSADLLYVNSLCWGLSLLQVVFLPSLIGCRPLFFFRWLSSGIHLPTEVYQPTLWLDKLEVLRSSQGSHLSLFPATAAKTGFMLIVYSSGNHPLVNCVPDYSSDMPSAW